MAALVRIRHDPVGQLMCDLNHQDECQHAAQAERERIIQLLQDQITQNLDKVETSKLPNDWASYVYAIATRKNIELITGETNA